MEETISEVRSKKLTVYETIEGTSAFFYYVTLGYFFDKPKFDLAVKLFREI